MNYIVRRPHVAEWMNSLGYIVNANPLVWYSCDVTITPFNKTHQNAGYVNAGYVITINSWHTILVTKEADYISSMHVFGYRGKYHQSIMYDNFDKNPKQKDFWEKTINLIKNNVGND